MSFFSDIYEVISDGVYDLVKDENTLANFKAENRSRLNETTFAKEVFNLEKKREEDEHRHVQRAEEVGNRTKNKIEKYYVLNGDEITDDAKLFDSPIVLSEAEVSRLFDKYTGNYTMQRLIDDYATKKDIWVDHRVKTKEALKDSVDTFIKVYVRSCFQRPTYEELTSEEAVKAAIPDELQAF